MLCIFTSHVFATETVPVGRIFDGDLKTAVTRYTHETVSDEARIDINLDGKNEIAIGIACGNAGCDYHIFGATYDGRYKYLGNLFFHPLAFSIDPRTEIIETYVRLNAARGCHIYYTHGEQGFEQVKKECNY